MSKIGWLLVLMLIVLQLSAQTSGKIEVNVNNTPLNQVLLGLKEAYGFQFAFDNDLLSEFKISTNRSFDTQEECLRYLIRNIPLRLEKSGEVFLIIPKSQIPPANAETQISGQVLEAVSNEPLPYSYVLINRKPVQSDQLGNFTFIASADTGYNLQISHLGYHIYDTIVNESINRKFYLTPRIERINEVQIISNPVENATLIGDRAGRIKLNHQIAPILPGHGDNTIFTLLRLMPGIVAAGEQSNDLLIWGAYESHSKIEFDGFTLFGLKNFNDNIAVVNPFMVKNIEVLKGGYGVEFGDRVGGIVDISAKDGTMQKPTFTFTINSTTLNAMFQLPVSKNASLLGAYRQTYYQIYDPTSLSLFTNKQPASAGNPGSGATSTAYDFEVQPDYLFRDANLKYTYKNNRNEYLGISLYGGGDLFEYDMDREISRFLVRKNEKEKNRQYGASAKLAKTWPNNNVSTMSLAFSAFSQKSSEQNSIEHTRLNVVRITGTANTENTVNELSLKFGHTFNLKEGHKMLFSGGVINNHVQLSRIIDDETTIDLDNPMPRLFAFAQDELPVGELLDIKTGLRFTYASELNKTYIEPRISASLKLNDEMKINAAWGIYHQYTAKATLLDSAFNFSTFWVNATNIDIPVLGAQHVVGGFSYNNDGFTASIETYYKTTDGLTQYFRGNTAFETGFYQGEARSYGLDIFLKKEYKRHVGWISYTLSESEEHFPFYINEYYEPSPQHQKHELKFAGIFHYKSFYFSANYVYGSGFERFDIETENGVRLDQPYNRMDASVVYKFKPGMVKAEAGISILNVFNTDNIKYSNLNVTSVDEISMVGVYADAVPFTPTLFLKIEL